MSENNSRRSFLKKVATTGIASGALLATAGNAAAESYTLTVENAGDTYGEYEIWAEKTGKVSISDNGGTWESGDDVYYENGGYVFNGVVQSPDEVDSWNVEGLGDITIRHDKTDSHVTIRKE